MKKKCWFHLLATIVLLGVGIVFPIDTHASTKTTELSLTFEQAKKPDKPDNPDVEPIPQSDKTDHAIKPGRLPQTGDHYQSVFFQWGLFSLLLFFLCLIDRRSKEEKCDEAHV